MVREDVWYDLNFLKFTEVWFVTQDVVYPGECSMCTWEEGVFLCIWMECPETSMRSISSNVSFKTCVYLLIFCFDDLSIDVSGVLLSISPFMSVSVCLGEGNGTPLQYFCLENPMDGGAWKAAVHGVTKSRTQLSDFTFTSHFHALEKEMATHSSVLAWRIPGTGKPGGLRLWGCKESDTTEAT